MVFSHRQLFSGDFHLSQERPLPRFDEINDPVLAQFDRTVREDVPIPRSGATSFASGTGVTVDGASYLIIFKDVPDLIESAAHDRRLSAIVSRRERVRAAVVDALRRGACDPHSPSSWRSILGRRIGEPMRALADAHAPSGGARFQRRADLPRSRFREIDVAAHAYNSMRNGLGWFSTYVPQSWCRISCARPAARCWPRARSR